MQQVVLGALLEDGGRGLARLIGTLLVLILAAVLLLAAAILSIFQVPAQMTVLSAPSVSEQAHVGPPLAPEPSRQLAPIPTAIQVARRYLGVPYVFGGTDPALGLDCSGLVQLVFRQLGIALPRTAQLQYEATTRLTRDELQPGDLVFFARTYADPHDWVTHVGIYIGNGQQINAPTTGQVVSIQPVFSGFWGAHFTAGGRIRST